MQNYGAPELEFDHGEGTYLYTNAGERYLDFGAGIAVNSLGHCHPALIKALNDQAHKVWHTSNLYRIPQSEKLAARLAQLTFADRVFFCNSGTEAVEAGFKLIRRYQHAQGNHQRKRIIALSEAFHGRTLAPIAAAANPTHTDGFLVGDSGFDQAPWGDIDAVRRAITVETAGIIIEPVQGEGGIRVASEEFMGQLRQLCDDNDLALMLDEVQCGIGRSGTLYAYQQMGISPDVLASAKGLGGGFPVGACLTTEKFASPMTAGSHGSTFGGNPLAMAVANAVLDEVTSPGFLDNVNARAAQLHSGLAALVEQSPHLQSVQGLGLMVGLMCNSDAAELNKRLQAAGMLVVKAGRNSVRLLPPLTVNEAEVNQALEILSEVLSAWQ